MISRLELYAFRDFTIEWWVHDKSWNLVAEKSYHFEVKSWTCYIIKGILNCSKS